MAIAVVPVLMAAGPAAAGGDSACNYSSGQSTRYISIACETGNVQYVDTSNVTVPTASGSYSEFPSAVMYSWSGSPCTRNVYAGAIWESGTWHVTYGYNNSNGFNSANVTTTSAGSQYEVWLEYLGSGQYEDYVDGYQYTIGGLGAGSCYATAGTDIETEGAGLGNIHVGNSTFATLYWYDTGFNSHTGWNNDYISNPCGQGYSQPNCLNGAWYFGTAAWQSNKP